jgi:hypothetical protein
VTRLLALLAFWLAAPALAGVPGALFDDGRWRVLGMDAGGIPVTRGGAPLGSFASLDFRFALEAREPRDPSCDRTQN